MPFLVRPCPGTARKICGCSSGGEPSPPEALNRLTKSLVLTAVLAPLAVYVAAWSAQCYKPRRGDLEENRRVVRYVNVLGQWKSYGYSDPCREVISVEPDGNVPSESVKGQMVVSGGYWNDNGNGFQAVDTSAAVELGVRRMPAWLYKEAVTRAQLPCTQVVLELAGWPKPCLYSLRCAGEGTSFAALWDSELADQQKAPNADAFVWPSRSWTPVYRPLWGAFVQSLAAWYVLLFLPSYLLVGGGGLAAKGKKWWLRRRGRCPRCQYSMAGLPPSTPCPECGTV